MSTGILKHHGPTLWPCCACVWLSVSQPTVGSGFHHRKQEYLLSKENCNLWQLSNTSQFPGSLENIWEGNDSFGQLTNILCFTAWRTTRIFFFVFGRQTGRQNWALEMRCVATGKTKPSRIRKNVVYISRHPKDIRKASPNMHKDGAVDTRRTKNQMWRINVSALSWTQRATP